VSYIGIQPPKGQYRKLKSFESSFDGVTTAFQLEVEPGGVAYYVVPGSANQLIVSLGGVIQEPNVDYTVSSSQITFTTAPAAGLSCFVIQCGDALNTGVPGDGTVTEAKLGPDFSGATGATGSNDSVFYLNKQTVSANYTIPTGYNAGTFGPCTINSGITVTIPSGSAWVII
jgi:hypothetical protein